MSPGAGGGGAATAAGGGDGGAPSAGIAGGGSGGLDVAGARARIAHRIELHGMIATVLQKVLVAGVVDPDPTVRMQVLSSLGDRFVPHLAHPDALRAVLMAVDDEALEIRIATVALLGRLAHAAPALVLPRLRAKLTQLTVEIATHAASRPAAAASA